MPIAPPRLRIKLNKPLALGIWVTGKCPSASRVGGNKQNMIAAPRTTWGQNIASKSVSGVALALIAKPIANRRKPAADSTRASIRRSRRTAMGAATSCAAPVTSMISPMAKAPCPRTSARKTGVM